MAKKRKAADIVRGATKGKLTAAKRREVAQAIENRKMKAKKRGKPLTQSQVRKARKDLEATALRQQGRKKR